MRILVVHTFGLGDMIMLTPSLKRISSYSKIDFLVLQKISISPIENSELLNNVYFFSNSLTSNIKLILELRKIKYDYIIHSSGTSVFKISLMMLLLKGKNKIGEYINNKIPWYSYQVRKDDSIHRVQSNLRLFNIVFSKETLINNTFYSLTKEDLLFSDKFITSFANDLRIGIHPGCNENFSNKRWEIDKYVKLIKKFQTKYANLSIFIFVGPDEYDVGDNLKVLIPNVLIIKEKLSKTAAILSKMDLVITNDSGIGHLASCFNLNILTIFSKNSHAIPSKIIPYCLKSDYIDFRAVYTNDEVENVFIKACLKLIDSHKKKDTHLD